MKLKEVLEKSTHFFTAKNFSTPRLDAELLLSDALNLDRMQLYLNFDKPLSEQELSQCRELVTRRGKGEPVAYILGEREFYGLPFKTSPSVLIPRPETEHLVDEVLSWVKSVNLQNAKIIDLGTGSGCLAVTLAKKIPGSSVVAVDVCEEAIEVAKQNASLNSVGVHFVKSKVTDLPESVFIGVQIIVANPPYIASDDEEVCEQVKAYEPHLALFSDDGGMFDIKTWLQKIKQNLNTAPAIIAFEIGADQGDLSKDFVANLFEQAKVEVIKDYSSRDRVLLIKIEA